jgi:hypothetical protein
MLSVLARRCTRGAALAAWQAMGPGAKPQGAIVAAGSCVSGWASYRCAVVSDLDLDDAAFVLDHVEHDAGQIIGLIAGAARVLPLSSTMTSRAANFITVRPEHVLREQTAFTSMMCAVVGGPSKKTAGAEHSARRSPVRCPWEPSCSGPQWPIVRCSWNRYLPRNNVRGICQTSFSPWASSILSPTGRRTVAMPAELTFAVSNPRLRRTNVRSGSSSGSERRMVTERIGDGVALPSSSSDQAPGWISFVSDQSPRPSAVGSEGPGSLA